MSLLDKIVYVADYIEPGRDKAPRLAEIRKIAFENLDLALYRILQDTLLYLSSGEGEVDDMTQKAFDYYNTIFETEHNETKEVSHD